MTDAYSNNVKQGNSELAVSVELEQDVSLSRPWC